MDNGRTHFENLMGDYLILAFKESPTKEENLAKADAFMAVLQYVRSLEHTIQQVRNVVRE